MVQALVIAKTQTVKEIKKISSIKRRNKLIFKFLAIIIIVFLIALLLNKLVIENRYSFTDKKTNIYFKSNNFHIKEGFDVFSKDVNYTIVFNSLYSDQTYLSSVTEGLVFFQSMLHAKNKNVILIISLSDENNNLISCQSNLGNIYENKELTKDECLILIKSDRSTIMVDYPYESYINSNVLLNISEKLLIIKPSKAEDVYASLSLISNQMFSDSEFIKSTILDIQNKVNDSSNLDINKNLDINTSFEDINTSFDSNISDLNTFNDINS
jgi:hypothetical protein